MIEFKNVTKRFEDKTVLDDISFKVNEGEVVFVIGKSGVGKSVLLKNTVGLLRPDRGEIWVDGLEVSKLNEGELGNVRRKCGLVFQHPALLDSLTVFENVAFGLRANQFEGSESSLRDRVVEKMKWVHLKPELLKRYPPEISHTMQKWVAIARALVMEPKYLLFDEPTTAQDPVVTHLLNDLIQELSKKLKMTSIVVSHDMHCAVAIATHILMLEKGKIVARGSVNDLLESEIPIVQEFLKEAKERRFDQ